MLNGYYQNYRYAKTHSRTALHTGILCKNLRTVINVKTNLLFSRLHVDHKVFLYTYKAFYDSATPYICEMVTKYKPRSSGKYMFVVPEIKTNRCGVMLDIFCMLQQRYG